MPPEQYKHLVGLLVAFDRKSISMTRLISEVMILLDDHQDLVSGFRCDRYSFGVQPDQNLP